MATIHLLHGFTGAGKSTFAKKLKSEIKAMRFSPDEWMVKLYGSNPPEEKFAEYFERVESLIWQVASQVLLLEKDVILDFGFWSRAERDEARQKAKTLNADVRLYFISTPEEIMKQRVLQRTADLTDGNLVIDEHAFELFKSRFEALEKDETHIVIPTPKISIMKLDLHYTEPRFVAMYDTDNPHGPDTDFYIELAAQLEAKTILDLGCGTGLLTRALAAKGYNIMGIDPSIEMIAYGKKQTHGELVHWVEGDASLLGTPNADLVLLTGNVAQVFLDDEVWLDTLRSIYAALQVGGYVAFESRNPLARAWENWTPEATREVTDSPYGPLECWLEVIEVNEDTVHFQGHNIFKDTGETLVIDSTLRFRTQQEITEALTTVGFDIKNIYGGWQKQAMTENGPVMIFVAQKI